MKIVRKCLFWSEYKVLKNEYGLHFVDNEFTEVLKPGTYWFFNGKSEHRVEESHKLMPWILCSRLEEILVSDKLQGLAEVIDLKEDQRALVWIDGRFHTVLKPGRTAYWLGPKQVSVETVDAKTTRFQHPLLQTIIQTPSGKQLLQPLIVPPYHTGLLYYDGKFTEALPPGLYAFWKDITDVKLTNIDLREQTIDITGQELMTADNVTLRVNTYVCFKVIDAEKTARTVDDVQKALYRESQLVLRKVLGKRELEQFLSDKTELTNEAEQMLQSKTAALGISVQAFGIRDVILPGEMKELLNKVTEAKKAAEANLIVRREETAAMRSQANTAKLLENNPTLMRLRELEILEKLIASGKLQIVIGEKGLADKIVNLL